MSDDDKITDALRFIDPNDRPTWLACCFAIKSEIGDAGFEIWNDWSAAAGNYNEKDARSTWRHAKAEGGVKIGTLFALAIRAGWKPDRDRLMHRPDPEQRRRASQQRRLEAQRLAHRHAAAADLANKYVAEARVGKHAYLMRKGFPDLEGLIHKDGRLLIPMRVDKEIVTAQLINDAGEKKFLPGGRAKGAHFVIGGGDELFFCEGFATGLSISRALVKGLKRHARVVVCFSAQNIPVVAARFRGGVVVADHDESGAGETFAKKAGRPYWMPEMIGDANDFELAVGMRALALELNALRRRVNRSAADVRTIL